MDTPDYRPAGERAETDAIARPACDAADAARGSSPRLVTTGGKVSPPARPALIDWLNVSFPFAAVDNDPKRLVMDVMQGISPHFGGMRSLGHGINGFSHGFEFDAVPVRFACGGQRGMAWLSIPGRACGLIPKWKAVVHTCRDRWRGRPTRVDVAVDCLDGCPSVDDVLQWWREGWFGLDGRPPRMSQMGNWDRPDGRGRTLYVGERRNGKQLRAYEKGKQLGDATSPWTRLEVQFMRVDREIPWDILVDPAPYLAAAYPCLAWVAGTAKRIPTTRKAVGITYERLMDSLSIAYGRVIDVAMEVEGSAESVVARLRRPGLPRRLAAHLPSLDDEA